MKRIILALIIIAASATVKAQDSTQFVPNYGIEIQDYESIQIFGTDTISQTYKVKFMSPRFQENRVVFFYDVKVYSDTLLIKHDKNVAFELPLNALIQGKKVYEWLNDLYSPTDTLVLKGLSEKLFIYNITNGTRK